MAEAFNSCFVFALQLFAGLAGTACGVVCVFCLVALPCWLYGQIPAVKGRREAEEKSRAEGLACVYDLAEFLAGPCASSAVALEAKWPDWEERLAGACPLAAAIALEKGVYPAAVRAELEKLKTKEDKHD